MAAVCRIFWFFVSAIGILQSDWLVFFFSFLFFCFHRLLGLLCGGFDAWEPWPGAGAHAASSSTIAGRHGKSLFAKGAEKWFFGFAFELVWIGGGLVVKEVEFLIWHGVWWQVVTVGASWCQLVQLGANCGCFEGCFKRCFGWYFKEVEDVSWMISQKWSNRCFVLFMPNWCVRSNYSTT